MARSRPSAAQKTAELVERHGINALVREAGTSQPVVHKKRTFTCGAPDLQKL